MEKLKYVNFKIIFIATVLLTIVLYFFSTSQMEAYFFKLIKSKSVNESWTSVKESLTSINKSLTSVNEYLISVKEFMEAIWKKTGSKPTLLSYEVDVAVKRIHNKTGKAFIVPNVVHLISFGIEQPFMLYNYVAYKSFQKFLQPEAIILWADHLPSKNSKWWNQTLLEVANIYYMQTMPIQKISGKKVRFAAHASDYLRIQLIRGIPIRNMQNVIGYYMCFKLCL